MIYPFVPHDLQCHVVLAATGLDKTSGTIYAFVRRSSDGYYLKADSTWASGVPTGANIPTATHAAHGIWILTLTSAVTGALAAISPGATLSCRMTDHEAPASATVTSNDDKQTLDISSLELRDFIERQRGRHTAQGRTVYVAFVTGSDSTGDGSRAKPYKTVTKALSVVVAGTHSLIQLIADQASGVTVHTETIAWNKRYTGLSGPGRDYLIRGADSNTPAITVTADGAEFAGFQLESHATGANADGIEATAADFLYIHHVWVDATQGTGVELVNCSNCRIVDDNTFQGTGLNGSAHGLVIRNTGTGNSRYNVVDGNTFADVQGDAIRLSAAGSGLHEDTIVGKNKIVDSTGWGINITGSGVTHAMLTDNRLGGNSSGDINDLGTGTTQLNNGPWAQQTTAAAIKAKTDNLPATPASETNVTAVGVAVLAVQADTADIQSRLPAALVAGRMDSSVGAIAAGAITAASIATNAIDADALATDAVTEIAGAVNAGAAGSGSELLTVTVLDNLAAAVEGAQVYAHNAAGALVGTATTNASGVAVVNPGAGVITLTARFVGLVFAAEDVTVAVGVNQTAQLDGTVTSIPAAVAPDRCAVYLDLENPDGSPATTAVGTATLTPIPQLLADKYVSNAPLSRTADGSGRITWELPRNAVELIDVPSWVPGNGSGGFRATIVVPDAASAAVKDLLP